MGQLLDGLVPPRPPGATRDLVAAVLDEPPLDLAGREPVARGAEVTEEALLGLERVGRARGVEPHDGHQRTAS